MAIAVPMTPAAWVLASSWASVWDAPRFRSYQRLALDSAAAAPLLKAAASCVVTLQQHVAPADSEGLSHSPFGCSRELLTAALDGDQSGAALSHLETDPSGFVKALVSACFQTGDGEFLYSLTEEKLHSMIEEHCAMQMQLVQDLVRDPNLALQCSLDAATKAIKELLATQSQSEGALTDAAYRLTLAQRLDRVAAEVASKLAWAKERESPSSSTDNAETSPAGADEQALALAADMDVDPEADATEEDAPAVKRTKSQVVKSLQVQKVAKHIGEEREAIHDLKRMTSVLAQKTAPSDAVQEQDNLHEVLASVEQAQKRARNFGEDLVEDMLALDKLSNLFPEDRSERKKAIAELETLLEDVDSAKTRLAGIHRKLNSQLTDSQKKARKEEQKKLEQAHGPDSPARIEAESRAQQRQAALLNLAQALPSPSDKNIWRKVRLPLRFHAREEKGHYAVVATVTGLDSNDVSIELSDDKRMLTVSGLRVPSEQEAWQMKKKIMTRIQNVASQRSDQWLQEVERTLTTDATAAYQELGQGDYGRFSETFRIPDDVDPENINASYENGALRVVFQKSRPRLDWGDVMTGTQPLGWGARGGYGMPATNFGYPRRSPEMPPRGANLFGGVDRDYFW